MAAMLKRFNVQPSAAVRVRRVPKLAPSTKAPSKEESEDTAEALRHWESVTWGDFLRHWVDLGAAPKRPILRLLGDHATDDVDKRRLYHLSRYGCITLPLRTPRLWAHGVVGQHQRKSRV